MVVFRGDLDKAIVIIPLKISPEILVSGLTDVTEVGVAMKLKLKYEQHIMLIVAF